MLKLIRSKRYKSQLEVNQDGMNVWHIQVNMSQISVNVKICMVKLYKIQDSLCIMVCLGFIVLAML